MTQVEERVTQFTESHVEADGFSILYAEAGQRSPLVCFHGAGGGRATVAPEDRLGLLYAHPERQPPRPAPDPAILAKQETLLARLAGPARDPELEEQLGGLNVSTLVLFGTLDRSIPPEMGRIYREKLPNCHLVLVYDAGHALDMDRPEAFASV